MSDSKHERDLRAEAVQALVLIRERESYADVDAWHAWTANGDLVSAYPNELLDHITALTQRAEAAEARRREIDDEAFVYAEQVEVLKAECEALRKVDDAMVERAARATMNRVAEEDDLFADDEEALRIHREYARIALTAAVSALAVQPTTGDGDE